MEPVSVQIGSLMDWNWRFHAALLKLTLADYCAVAVVLMLLNLTIVRSAFVGRGWNWPSPLRSLVIPYWNFFGPAPGHHDYYLLVRTWDTAGVAGPWKEVPIIRERSLSLLSMVWNPRKHHQKAWLDIVAANLAMLDAFRNEPESVQLSVPYLSILAIVWQLPRSAFASDIQFAVARDTLCQSPEMILLSNRHALE